MNVEEDVIKRLEETKLILETNTENAENQRLQKYLIGYQQEEEEDEVDRDRY